MAVTTQITTATPYISGGVVIKWDIGMTYTNGLSSDSQYFTKEYIVKADHEKGPKVFGLSALSAWNTNEQLEAICPNIIWGRRFNRQLAAAFNLTTDEAEVETDTTYVPAVTSYQIPTV